MAQFTKPETVPETKPPVYVIRLSTWCFVIGSTSSFHQHNLVVVRFLCTKISRPEWETMLRAIRIFATFAVFTAYCLHHSDVRALLG